MARVENKYLYQSDIEDLGLQFASSEDSTKLITEYVNNWIRRQLMYTYAQKNLPPDKLDVEQLIEDYRQSLIIYTYEREYIAQNLDTAVTRLQAETFFKDNQANFQLSEDLYRVLYLKVAADAPKQDSIALWMQADDAFMRARLIEYANTYATEYNVNDSLWQAISLINKKLSGIESTLRPGAYLMQMVPPFHYHLWVTHQKIKDEVAPFSYVESDVKRMIVNKRKLALKKDFNDNIYKDAAKNNTFEIYE